MFKVGSRSTGLSSPAASADGQAVRSAGQSLGRPVGRTVGRLVARSVGGPGKRKPARKSKSSSTITVTRSTHFSCSLHRRVVFVTLPSFRLVPAVSLVSQFHMLSLLATRFHSRAAARVEEFFRSCLFMIQTFIWVCRACRLPFDNTLMCMGRPCSCKTTIESTMHVYSHVHYGQATTSRSKRRLRRTHELL